MSDVTLLYGTAFEFKNRKTLVDVIRTAEIEFLRNIKKCVILYKINITDIEELCFFGI